MAGLAAVAAGRPAANVVTGSVPAGGSGKTVFVFAGHGAQWAGMGRDLAAGCPVFAARLAECAAALAPHVSWNLLEVMNEAAGAPGLEGEDVLQPVLWAVSVALAAVWEAAGVTPDAVAGHSQGEIAAATVAGMLSVQDAALVIAARGRVLAGLGGHGGMLSVAAPAAEVGQVLAGGDGRVSVAAVNSPGATVVAGDLDALAELAGVCAGRGWRTRPVPIGYAAHSAQVEAAEQELTAALAGVRPGPGRVAMISAMTGELVQGAELGAGYWYASLRAPVQFARAVTTLAGAGHGVFIEVSPHPVLAAAVTETLDQDGHAAGDGHVVSGTLRRGDGGSARLLASLARAHVGGISVDWAAVLGRGSVVELPTYAFQRERFWPRPAPAGAGDVAAAGLGAVSHPLLGAAVQVAGGDQVILTGRVSAGAQPWLADHVVGGVVLVPGTALLELAVRAGDAAGCGQVTELALQAPLVLPADGAVQVQVVVGGVLEAGGRPVEVFARPAGAGQDEDSPWTCHARGLLAPAGQAGAQAAADTAAETAWPPPGAVMVDTGGWYERLAGGGLEYGQAFRGLQAAWRRGDEVFAEAVLPEVAGDAAGFGLHPALLDAVLHAAGLTGAGGDGGGMVVPFAWSGVVLHAAGAGVLRARLRRTAGGTVTLTAADGAGRPVITVRGLALRPVTAAQLQSSRDVAGQGLFSVDWVPVPVPVPGGPGGSWAVAGPDPYRAAAGLAAAGVRVASYPDLAALAAVVSGGAPVPDLIAVTAAPGAGEPDGAGQPDGEGHPGDAGVDVGVVAGVLAGRVLGWVQEWLAGPAGGARLVVLTRGAVPAGAGELVSGLAGSGVWGLVRSVQAENPGRVILADLPGTGSAAEGGAAPGDVVPVQVFGVLAGAVAGSGEPEVAVRDGQVFGRRLGRPARGLPAGTGEPVRAAGTVLVTGGTGMLGALTARHLVSAGRAGGCVLVSRSGPAAPGVPVLAAGLARAGAGVRVLAADLARPGVAAAVVAAAAGLGGPLSLVVHAAGVIDDGTIATMTPGRVAAVMAPKAAAAWQLHLATRDRDLDGFVMFSSAASVLGGAGQGGYAAANAFLDALAAYRHAAGLPAQSLAWGLWEADSAITAGLGQGGRARITRSGMTALADADGLALLDAAAGCPEPLLLAARLDLPRILGQAARAGAVPPLWRGLGGGPARPAAGAASAGGLQRQLAGLAAAEQDRVLTGVVRDHAAAVLGHASAAAVEPGRAFTELGFDSLAAVELRNLLSTVTGLTLPATSIFDYPTPVALAGYLRAHIAGQKTDYLPALEELERLKSVLSSINRDGDGWRMVAARLEIIMKEFRAETVDSVSADQELEAATDDEMFDLVERELNTPDLDLP